MANFPVVLTLELYLTRENLERFRIAQGSYGWLLQVHIKSSDDTLMTLSGCTVRLCAIKSDGTAGYYDGTILDDQVTAQWTVPQQVTAVAGPIKLSIEISDEKSNSAMQTITCVGIVSPGGDNVVTSSNDFAALIGALGRVDSLSSDLEDAINDASRGPQIKNGMWQTWSADTDKYVDTGVRATGPEGPAGPKGDPISIGGSYSSVPALNQAYPSGDDKAYFVDGYVYFWDGSAWTRANIDAALGDIDCGTWDEDSQDSQVAAHSMDANAHPRMLVDGNTSEPIDDTQTLAAHEANPQAHQNIVIDGNIS